MAFIYYTIAGIVLYLGSDWLLNRIEMSRGKRFEHRSAIFFVIIVVLAVGSFQMIEYMMTAS
jgi:zinc transporter ZupT